VGGGRVALRKCIVIGGQAGSAELRDWATNELRGYDGDDDLPEPRILVAPILVDAMKGNVDISRQRIAPLTLADFVQERSARRRFRSGVGEIEALVRQASRPARPWTCRSQWPPTSRAT